MKYFLFCIGLFIITISCDRIHTNSKKTSSTPEIIDTLLNLSNHRLHFKIYKGKGTPILFESGAGDECSVWDTILMPIAKTTGATLITYDRAGFGSSSIDSNDTNISKHDILSGLKDLEKALKLLGYNKEIMLVSHSYGGYLTTLYADKYPNLVKSIVLIDVNHNFYQNTAAQEIKEHKKEILEAKNNNIAFYYMAVNLPNTAQLLSTVSIPKNIPVVDFVSGISFHETKQKTEQWMDCHKKFVKNHPKCKGITAVGCGHYVWLDNPNLVISEIAKSYARINYMKER